MKSSSRWVKNGILFILFSALFFGCSAKSVKVLPEDPAKRPVSQYVDEDKRYGIQAYDPWEGFNRGMYRFNARLDKYFLLPVVGAYEAVTPDPLERGISNFFANLGELKNLVNSLLQLKPTEFSLTAGRVILNSTAGVLGLFDPATEMGIYRQDEDFGQTLGHYGAGPGPYLVLPVFGPSSLRDTTGLAVDSIVNYVVDPLNTADVNSEYAAAETGLKSVDKRHSMGFRYNQTGSPFEYELVRLLYLKKRVLQILR